MKRRRKKKGRGGDEVSVAILCLPPHNTDCASGHSRSKMVAHETRSLFLEVPLGHVHFESHILIMSCVHGQFMFYIPVPLSSSSSSSGRESHIFLYTHHITFTRPCIQTPHTSKSHLWTNLIHIHIYTHSTTMAASSDITNVARILERLMTFVSSSYDSLPLSSLVFLFRLIRHTHIYITSPLIRHSIKPLSLTHAYKHTRTHTY